MSPGLSRLGRCPGGGLSPPLRSGSAARATTQAGAAGTNGDAALVEAIRQMLTDSRFHGEGYRKVRARLRHAGLRTSKECVRRLMRENGLSAATRSGGPRGPRNHVGTIIPEAIDTMWGTDMTATFTVEHGQVAVFIAVELGENFGIHAALHGTRHETLEPIRQGVTECFGGVGSTRPKA